MLLVARVCGPRNLRAQYAAVQATACDDDFGRARTRVMSRLGVIAPGPMLDLAEENYVHAPPRTDALGGALPARHEATARHRPSRSARHAPRLPPAFLPASFHIAVIAPTDDRASLANVHISLTIVRLDLKPARADGFPHACPMTGRHCSDFPPLPVLRVSCPSPRISQTTQPDIASQRPAPQSSR